MAEGAALAATAMAVIRRSGTTYTLSRDVVTPSTSSPWKSSSTTTSTETVYGTPAAYVSYERAGTEVRTADRQYVIAAQGMSMVPQAGDTITDGTDVLGVVDVAATRCGTTAVMYTLRVRR